MAEATTKVIPRLKQRYLEEVRPALMREFGYRNIMEVPRVWKVVVNVGVGEAVTNPKALDYAVQNIATITGQKPLVTKARKSIAAFKLRAGRPIGVKVTLRGDRMWAFLDRLFNVALPRIRDFRGVSRIPSTAGGITPWGCASSWSGRRSTTARWIKSGGWRSPL